MIHLRPRLLVALHEPGYFRMWGSTICELERRGWSVAIAFDTPEKRGGAQVPSGAGPHVSSLGALPAADADGVVNRARLAVDYIRYLEPRFAAATYLRERAARKLPPGLEGLGRVHRLPGRLVNGILRLARAVESIVPADSRVVNFIREVAPQLVLVSPLVTMNARGAGQTEVVKAAKTLGIPVVVGVASWDHLSSKGLIRVVPDLLTVWNEAQRREAVAMHHVPNDIVVVTGAQPLDHWFTQPADPGGARLRASLGVAEGQRMILFVGSSLNMAPGDTEVTFVRAWLAQLRGSVHATLREAFVLVRPHPSNLRQWTGVSLDDPAAVVHPRRYSGMPLQEAEVEEFRAAMLASDAVVGINTTAMIEAAIHERPVLTVRDPAFRHSQEQTLHFGYLASDDEGCTVVGTSLEAHVAQLAAVVADRTSAVDAGRRFVGRFVRPHGLEHPASTHVADAIERCAQSRGVACSSSAAPAGAAPSRNSMEPS